MTFEEKTLESELVYEGKIFKVRKHKVTAPGGTAYRDVVEHRGGVGIVAINKEGKLILIKQFRKAAEQVLWEIPAGKVEADEVDDLQATAVRELKEETGYTAENPKYLGGFYATCGYCNEKIHIFYADATDKGETHFDPTEAIDTYEVDMEEALKMIESGEIIDMKTAVGILMASKFLDK